MGRPQRVTFCCHSIAALALASLAATGPACSDRAEPCGNGLLELDEACDGAELGGQTCQSLGFQSGQLACSPDCSLDTDDCVLEVACDPACDPDLCESCFRGECVSDCQAWEFCEAGSCTVETIDLRFFFTSDEHGWISSGWSDDGRTFYGGAAELMTLLRDRGYEPGGTGSALFSDGDMWTGPAVSTWYGGQSVVEVMNAMGYSAAAVGNHEFDFGQDVLSARSQEADFPFLAANLLDAGSGEPPAYAQPFTVVEVNGVQVGVIGLTLDALSYVVCSDNLAGLEETGYVQALRDTVPLARAAGAEALIVIAHVCPDDLMGLTWLASELGIALLAAGHCHSTFVGENRGVLVVSPGSSMVEFAQVDLQVDAVTFQGVDVQAEIVDNLYQGAEPEVPDPDPAIQDVVDFWLDREDEELGEVIGYTATGIYDWPLNNMASDAMLMAWPEAHLAVMSTTGFRSSYSPGDISVADTVSVQPFENYLVVIELTGAQIIELFDSLYWPQCIAGALVDKSGGQITVVVDGGTINPATTYNLVTTDYMLCQPDYFPYQVPAENVTFTHIHWRQATEDWIRARDSSGEDPLEDFLDSSPRWLN